MVFSFIGWMNFEGDKKEMYIISSQRCPLRDATQLPFGPGQFTTLNKTKRE